MLIHLHAALEAGQPIRIEKYSQGRDVSHFGAFAYGTEVELRVRVPRKLGVSAVVLRIAPDGDETRDVALTFLHTEGDEDRYAVTLSTSALCRKDETDGLFFYELLFLRGFDTLFTNSINNVDFDLQSSSGEKFRLLVYQPNYETPSWFGGGVMYHIFPDRFCRGVGEVTLRHGAKLDENWESGTPQFAKQAGAPLSNNVFFGGNLWGVIEKLPYLKSLGVTVLYLSPIFEAASNHRYDTADYEKVDGLLGGDAAFDALIAAAHKLGLRVILDGVFNHTGDDSRYFNRRGNYPDVGAYQSKQSPYAKWFTFRKFPNDYESWWGIEIMPRLRQNDPACRSYFTGENGIVAKWLRRGADGWRLDVADELPDAFLDELRSVAKRETDGEALLIGEVWENAVDKISYGSRRRYFRGGQLDSVMNYPFRNAVMSFVLDRDGETFYNTLTELYGTYPKQVSDSLMNLLGTHDTERILTLLGDGGKGEGLENPALAKMHLTPVQKELALRRLKLAATLQFTVYGVPSVYYGDEAGVEGYHDPFCRRPFPWGREEQALLEHYRALGALRARCPVFRDGDFAFVQHSAEQISYVRKNKNGQQILVAANVAREIWHMELSGAWKNALTGETVSEFAEIPPECALVLEKV